MKSLTVCITTSREHPETDWIIDSLKRQTDEKLKIIVVSLHCEPHRVTTLQLDIRYVKPKPNIWQGQYRLPKDDWWAVSNARNTAICLCDTEWIAFLDDRSVLMPNWLNCVKEAMENNYIMAGAYEKRHNLVVENGAIVDFGTLQAKDARIKSTRGEPIVCPGEWLFGCNLAMPLEWLLKVNSYPERADSVSFEDCLLGLTLANNGFPMRFDPRAKMIEDRTPEKLGTPMKRSAKEKHPNDTTDKCHTLLRWTRSAKRSDNPFDIRELRTKIQAGEPFPIPNNPDERDWFDNQLIRDFT